MTSGVHSAGPASSPATSENQGGTRFWQRHARRYDRATLFLNGRFQEMAALVASELDGRQNVLEVAAGTGLVTVHVARVVQRLLATDLSGEMLDILQGRITSESLTNVVAQQASALTLPFPDQAFDGVVAANLLHLVPKPAAVLSELRRVLRAGGTICVPTFEHGATPLARATSRILRLAGFPVTTRFRGDMLRTLLSESGFSVFREVALDGILPLRYIAAVRPD